MTDNEIHDCFQQRSKDKVQERRLIADAIEAKLKVRWQGLTDDDVHEITKDVIAFRSDVVKFIREAEAKLKERNT
jgi:hypothetical protein